MANSGLAGKDRVPAAVKVSKWILAPCCETLVEGEVAARGAVVEGVDLVVAALAVAKVAAVAVAAAVVGAAVVVAAAVDSSNGRSVHPTLSI